MDSEIFYILLYIHLIGVILGFGSVMVTDLFGLLWIFDRVRFPQVVRVSGVTKNFIWTGWCMLVLTGIFLITFKGFIDNLMIIKLFFVTLIGINGIPLHVLQNKLTKYQVGENVPLIIMFRLFLALTVSQMSWWGALTIGFFHRHVQSIIQWPNHPIIISASILTILVMIWTAGEMLFYITNKNNQ